MGRISGLKKSSYGAIVQESLEATATQEGKNDKAGLDVHIAGVGVLIKKLHTDSVTATTLYIAEAAPGTLITSAEWRVKRLTVSGLNVFIHYQDGNRNFDNLATDAALEAGSYS